MISYSQALHFLQEVSKNGNHGSERIRVSESMGRISAESIRSPEPVPAFPNSSMDGFLVHVTDTEGASSDHPVRIPVIGTLAAGDLEAYTRFSKPVPGVALEIMTGAPVPPNGMNAVIKVEEVKRVRDPSGQGWMIELLKPAKRGEFIREKGTDFEEGQKVLEAGTPITSEHGLALASLGITEVPTRKFPKVFLISTGTELVDPSERKLSPGMVRNSTASYLISTFSKLGIEVEFLGLVKDDPAEFEKKLNEAMDRDAGIVISTGAVSMGKYDFVREVLEKRKAKIHFHKVSIRPGKPILFAELERNEKRCAFFGIPGNPVSTAVGIRFFLLPFLRGRMGLKVETMNEGILKATVQKPEGLRCFYKAHAKTEGGKVWVEVLEGQASYQVSSLIQANCWVMLEEGKSQIDAGALVQFCRLDSTLGTGGF